MFVYCGNNPVMHYDPMGTRFADSNQLGQNAMLYGANNSNIYYVHFDSPEIWEEDLLSFSTAIFDTRDIDPDFDYYALYFPFEASILDVTNSGLDVASVSLSWCSFNSKDDSLSVSLLNAGAGVGYNRQYYAGAMVSAVEASYSFSFFKTNISLTGRAGSFGIEASIGADGWSFDLSAIFGFGICVSW